MLECLIPCSPDRTTQHKHLAGYPDVGKKIDGDRVTIRIRSVEVRIFIITVGTLSASFAAVDETIVDDVAATAFDTPHRASRVGFALAGHRIEVVAGDTSLGLFRGENVAMKSERGVLGQASSTRDRGR